MVVGLHPVVGQWYENQQTGKALLVLAVNQEESTVDIQHFDGDLDELGFEDWYELDLEPAEPPEDWSGSVDVPEPDDMGFTEL